MGPVLLQRSAFLNGTAHISGCPFHKCSVLQIFLGEEVRDGGVPTPTRLRHLLFGAPGLAWFMSTVRLPAPSIRLSLCKLHQSLWCPATSRSSQEGPQGTDCPCPFSPLGSALKIAHVAETEAPSSLCTFTAQPKGFPEPHAQSVAEQDLVLGVHHHARGQDNGQ